VVVIDDVGEFGRRLRAHRRSAHLSQEELAERAGLSARTIRNLEQGRTRWPYPGSVQRLADALWLRGDARAEFVAVARRRLMWRDDDQFGALPGGGAGPAYQGSMSQGSMSQGSMSAAPVGVVRRRAAGLAAGGPVVVPRQLPASVPVFVGRRGALRTLSQVLHEPSGAAAIIAIGGTAGVGKTALAVYWAHQVAAQFPDGQLYVNLRGFDPSAAPVTPAEAVAVLLAALDVPPQQLPASVDARLALYRSLLIGRRMLVVLDNARDAAQARPLLPGSPTCRVLVTSRTQLAGLVARESADLVTLDVLDADEARELLAARLGAARVAESDAAVDQIIEHCARLPLALCVIAARAALRPDLSLAGIAEELAVSRPALRRFEVGGDPAADVGAAFSWSYQWLTEPAKRMFRLLGLHPGPEISAAAAASLAGLAPEAAGVLLTELVDCCLLTRLPGDRYSFHDLLRAYAADRAEADEDGAERAAALRRMCDHYLHSAYHAALLAEPRQQLRPPPPAGPGVLPESMPHQQAAMDWFDREFGVLVGLVGLAAANGLDAHAMRLPLTLRQSLQRRGLWEDWESTHATALAVSERVDDPWTRAVLQLSLANCHVSRKRWEHAQELLHAALAVLAELDDRLGQAHCYVHLGRAAARRGRDDEAIELTWNAHRIYTAIDDPYGQAGCLINIGLWCLHLRDYEQSRRTLASARQLCAEHGDHRGEAQAVGNLGLAYQGLGDYAQAVACHQRGAELFHAAGDLYFEAVVLAELGDAYRLAGDLAAAVAAWERSARCYEQIRHSEADVLRARVAEARSARRAGADGRR
jgi:tetratricopeptide (TPR) repeat protein